MRLFICLIICVLNSSNLFAQSLFTHGRLQVTRDRHYLQFADGTSFFWLGDTGWELFHRLNLCEIKQYPDNRAAEGFIVQALHPIAIGFRLCAGLYVLAVLSRMQRTVLVPP